MVLDAAAWALPALLAALLLRVALRWIAIVVATLAVAGVGLFHDWGAIFYFNAMVAAAVAILVAVLLRDTPQSCGLPTIEAYKNDYGDYLRMIANEI